MAVWVGTKDEKGCLEQKEEDRVRERERKADLCMKQAVASRSFCFVFFLPQSRLLKAAVAQPALYFHLIRRYTCHTCIKASAHSITFLSYELQYMLLQALFFIPLLYAEC